MFHNARCVDCTFMWRWRLGCARMCVCVCPSTWRGICVCVCWQAGSEKRSGGACVAAALAQHRSLATAGSAHLKHVQAVFPGPPTRPPSLREGVNRPVCMKLRFEYLLKKRGGGIRVCLSVLFYLCVCVRKRERWVFRRRLPVRQTHPFHMQQHQHSINNESRCPCCRVNVERSRLYV